MVFTLYAAKVTNCSVADKQINNFYTEWLHIVGCTTPLNVCVRKH